MTDFIADMLAPLDTANAQTLHTGWLYVGHWRIGHSSPAAGVTVRVSIKRDFYDRQSSAVVAAWSPESLSWNPVASIPFSAMRVCETIAGVPKTTGRPLSAAAELAFEVDARNLLDSARMVLLGGRLAL